MPAFKGQGKTRISNSKKQDESEEKKSLSPRHNRKRTSILHRVQSQNTNEVNDIIYGFLGNLAAVRNNQRNSKSKRFKVPGVKIKRQGRVRKNTKSKSNQKIRKLSFAPSESHSRLTDDSFVTETRNSETSKSSSVYNDNDSTANDSDFEEPADSKKGIKNLMRRKSLVEIINNYIKNGIKEDMKKEKRYIKEALSFGVNAGYLRPLDNSGHLLEVSSELPGIMLNDMKDTVTERRRRKNMRRGIVSFDDYIMKSSKKRASKKETEKRHKETNTNVLKKRSISNVNQSTSKVENKKIEKKPPPKKRAKIARQSRKPMRNSKKMRRHRSPTPWRNSNLCEKDEESPVDNGENDHGNGENDDEKENDNKNDNDSNNSTTDTIENRKSATTIFRKDDSKKYHENHSENGSRDNFSTELQHSNEKRKALSNDAESKSKNLERKGDAKSNANENLNRKQRNLGSERHAEKSRNAESNHSMEECDSQDEDSDNEEYEDVSESSSVISTASKNESQSDSIGKSEQNIRVATDVVEIAGRKRKHKSSDSQSELKNDKVQDSKRQKLSKDRKRRSQKRSGNSRNSNNIDSEEIEDGKYENKNDNKDNKKSTQKKRKIDEMDKKTSSHTCSVASSNEQKETPKENLIDYESSDDDDSKN
ncbi:uncharacterized protein MAL13P1.304-like [Leptopilina heterotoma]|uniref:uncharacterized protein MAL13P1.304-like n=1 Tax=Leptopilina heterotoma TaxID=63436 RepID=UPI001CA86397|nr:uncharacterized protein MAL13P1.304-like [Leptopilina heterotoma]